MATNGKDTRYYCNRHYWAMKSRVDKWLDSLEPKEWKEQSWYPHKKPKQQKLLT